MNVDLLVQLLEDDYDLIVAWDGEAGVELAARERPDLILMDMSLPKMDGWEATTHIRANPDIAAVPIIAVSANARPEDIDRAIEAGCNAYIAKPIDEDELFDTVEHLLNG